MAVNMRASVFLSNSFMKCPSGRSLSCRRQIDYCLFLQWIFICIVAPDCIKNGTIASNNSQRRSSNFLSLISKKSFIEFAICLAGSDWSDVPHVVCTWFLYQYNVFLLFCPQVYFAINTPFLHQCLVFLLVIIKSLCSVSVIFIQFIPFSSFPYLIFVYDLKDFRSATIPISFKTDVAMTNVLSDTPVQSHAIANTEQLIVHCSIFRSFYV